MRFLAPSAAVVLLLTLALPAGAQDPVRVPPALERAPDDVLYVEPRFTPTMTAEGVVYGQAVNVAGEVQDLTLDVWEPSGHDEEFRPVVLWAPGGGFTRIGSGLSVIPLLVERGYVVLHINNYRVRPDMPHGFEDFLSPDGVMSVAGLEPIEAARDAQHDMQAAVRWVRANAAELRVDPTRIVAGGHSAGGALAWLVAYNDGDPGESGNPDWPSHVAAGVVSAGGYITPAQGVITPGKPPILAMHGTNDTTVPMASSTVPCANTIALGNVCEHLVFPGHSHGGLPTDVRAAEAADFIWRHVLNVERVETELVGVKASGQGGVARVTGRLVTADGRPLAGERVLARATSGWADTRTGLDGRFNLDVPAPDHGRSTEVSVRYDGRSTTGLLGGPDHAPTGITVTATWGGAPAP